MTVVTRASNSDVSFLAVTTFFNSGDRVLAPNPDDPSGALRAAKMGIVRTSVVAMD
jgi:hypothetical protein